MLSCKEIAQQASDYIDQQHSWQQRMGFRLHLFMCRNCRRYISQLRSTISSLKLVSDQATPALTEQQKLLVQRLREQAQKR